MSEFQIWNCEIMFEDASQGCYLLEPFLPPEDKQGRRSASEPTPPCSFCFIPTFSSAHINHITLLPLCMAALLWASAVPTDIAYPPKSLVEIKKAIIPTVGFPHMGVMRLYGLPETRTSLTTPPAPPSENECAKAPQPCCKRSLTICADIFVCFLFFLTGSSNIYSVDIFPSVRVCDSLHESLELGFSVQRFGI